ncbi:MAG: hypothetical protein PUC26_07895 [Eubacteriales bacterium]|nr:hypothetical protein [Eubacteriales bacterium]
MKEKTSKKQARPQILFLGNGINLAYTYRSISWLQLMQDITMRSDLSEEIYRSMPFPLQVVLRTGDQVDLAVRSYSREFYGILEDPQMIAILQRILRGGYDHILTTNYSYELEAAAIYPRPITDHFLKQHMKHTAAVSRAEAKYLLHTYEQVSFEGVENKIWHIHGEARKPDSMILGHYYYGNLLYHIQQYLEKSPLGRLAENKPKTSSVGKRTASWVDAFLTGDVYVIGFGYDFSELDLWWLLNRKKLEKNGSRLYFYRPSRNTFDRKRAMLDVYRAKTIDLGYACEEMETRADPVQLEEAYKAFYSDVMDDIERRSGRSALNPVRPAIPQQPHPIPAAVRNDP